MLTPWIRKLVALGLACLLVVALAGCGDGKNQKLGGTAPMPNPSEVKNVEMGGPPPKPPPK